MTNVDVNVKNITYVEKIIFGIFSIVVAQMLNMKQILWMIQ